MRPWQFSIRTLAIIVAICALFSYWIASRPGKYSQGSVDRMMRSQNSDFSRYFASREQLGCELGEREECHDGILPRTVSSTV